MKAFHSRLDETRRQRGLTWQELAEEINRPFLNTPSIPIHPSTLRGMLNKRSVTSAVILQACRWLGDPPEAFLIPPHEAEIAHATLPRAAADHILRLDTAALHAALDAQRRHRGLTWAQVAEELPGFRPNMLTRLRSGPLIGFPRVMLLTQWLNLPIAHFVRARSR